jgi:hypothetical protein
MARKFSLDTPQPIMCTTAESGEGSYLFQSGDKLYFWEMIEGSVWEVLKPCTLDEILSTMIKKGERALKVKERRGIES